ncbi:3-hydroxyacyl-CoA dehydrogenase NAD-binding domain-containing protein [Enterovibrio sp. Hal110]
MQQEPQATPFSPQHRRVPPSIKDVSFDEWRSKLAKKAKGQFAPQRAIDAIEAATLRPFDEAIKLERRFFLACRDSEQSASMRYAFFAEKQSAAAYKPSTISSNISSISVIGAGTMGIGIAIAFIDAGFNVTLVDTTEEQCSLGLKKIREHYEKMHEKGRISIAEKQQALSLMSSTYDYGKLADIDLVVEAAFEKMSVKKMIFPRSMLFANRPQFSQQIRRILISMISPVRLPDLSW